MRIIRDIVYGEYPTCKLDVYWQEAVQEMPVYIYIHGGGIEAGHKADAPKLLSTLAWSGINVVSVDYRLYPDAKFPDYLQDVAKAVKWVQQHKKEYNFGKVVLGGSSAGAYICMMLYFNQKYFNEANVDCSEICGYLFDAGQPTTHFNYLKYEKKVDSRRVVIDEAAPLYYLTKEYESTEKVPCIMITCSERDIVNRVEQLQVLKTAMLDFGFPQNKMFFQYYLDEVHCGYVEKEFYIQDTLEFIQSALREDEER